MASEPGIKFDEKKPRWELLPLAEVEEVVRVLSYGAAKYTADGWQTLPDAKDRYFAATLRHLVAWRNGEFTDSESGLSHLAHAATSILFVMWHDSREAAPVRRSEEETRRVVPEVLAHRKEIIARVRENLRGIRHAHVRSAVQAACDDAFGTAQFDMNLLIEGISAMTDWPVSNKDNK